MTFKNAETDLSLDPEATSATISELVQKNSPDVSRRVVLAASAWAVPAISLSVASPAFAGTSDPGITLSAPNGRVPAAGAVTVSATVRDSSGAPMAGTSVSFTGPSGASFSPATATTDTNGTATTQLNLGTPWARPGSTVTVSAVASGYNASVGFIVLGANALVSGGGSTAFAQEQLVFPSPIVQAIGSAEAQTSTDTNQFYRIVLLENGTVWSRGANVYGQLGDGTTTARSTWAPIVGLSNVVQIASGEGVCWARISDGTVLGWGKNDVGQVGAGDTDAHLTPTPVLGLTDVTGIAGSTVTCMALLSDKTVRSWGYGAYGRLGNGAENDQWSPVTVTGLTDVDQIAYSAMAGYALRSDGSVVSWGWNSWGQLGDSSSGNRSLYGPVEGLSSGVVSIGADYGGGFAVLSDGSVRAWGSGAGGRNGNGSNDQQNSPVTVTGLTGPVAVGGYRYSDFALMADGSLMAWGSNAQGQLGVGSGWQRTTPVAVTGLSGRKIVEIPRSRSVGTVTMLVTALD